MKKVLLLLLTVSILVFTSCSKEEENTPKKEDSKTTLLGKWFLVSRELNSEDLKLAHPCEKKTYVEITDTKYTEEIYSYSTGSDRCWDQTEKKVGTYKINDDLILVSLGDGKGISYRFKIDDNKLNITSKVGKDILMCVYQKN